MPAYVVATREKMRNAAKIDEYAKLVPATLEKHHGKFLALRGRQEVLEGPQAEAIVVLEFPSYEAARAWYYSAEYQAAAEHRHLGGDYRFILTEGVAPK
jgi:uncharacterized protein (DUF1330 family)